METQVDFTVKANIKDTPTEQLHILEAMKIDVRGIMDVKGYTNVSMGQWEAKVDIQLSPGHEENRAKIVLTHTVPGEKIFKVRKISRIEVTIDNWFCTFRYASTDKRIIRKCITIR